MTEWVAQRMDFARYNILRENSRKYYLDTRDGLELEQLEMEYRMLMRDVRYDALGYGIAHRVFDGFFNPANQGLGNFDDFIGAVAGFGGVAPTRARTEPAYLPPEVVIGGQATVPLPEQGFPSLQAATVVSAKRMAGVAVGEIPEELVWPAIRVDITSERTLALLPSSGGAGPLRWRVVSRATPPGGAVHGNSLLATGPHDVYAVFNSSTGEILHIGETGRGYLVRGNEWQRAFFEMGIDADIVRIDTAEGKVAAKQLESQYLYFFRNLYGPDGLN